MIRNPHTGFRSLGILEAGPMLEQGVYIDTANLKPPLNMDAADVELNIPSLAGIAKFRNVARLTIASWADGGNTDQQTLQQRGDRHDYFTSSPRNENIAPLYCVTSFVGEQGMSAGIWVNTSEITNRVFNGRRHVEYPGIRHTNGQIGMLAWYNIAIKNGLHELVGGIRRPERQTAMRLIRSAEGQKSLILPSNLIELPSPVRD